MENSLFELAIGMAITEPPKIGNSRRRVIIAANKYPGMTDAQLADLLGVSSSTVSHIRKKAGLQRYVPKKWTALQKQVVKTLYAWKRPPKNISNIIGMPASSVTSMAKCLVHQERNNANCT